jgi:phosphoribosylanthranilate isomerase
LNRRVFKAIGLGVGAAAAVGEFDPDVVLLVDAHDPARRGGTGRTVNWDSAREIAATRRTILAGGLNAANVKLALRTVRPFGIDVSSGVESSPGIKDSNRLRSFFEALHD